jgi:hypothetical protein
MFCLPVETRSEVSTRRQKLLLNEEIDLSLLEMYNKPYPTRVRNPKQQSIQSYSNVLYVRAEGNQFLR